MGNLNQKFEKKTDFIQLDNLLKKQRVAQKVPKGRCPLKHSEYFHYKIDNTIALLVSIILKFKICR